MSSSTINSLQQVAGTIEWLVSIHRLVKTTIVKSILISKFLYGNNFKQSHPSKHLLMERFCRSNRICYWYMRQNEIKQPSSIKKSKMRNLTWHNLYVAFCFHFLLELFFWNISLQYYEIKVCKTLSSQCSLGHCIRYIFTIYKFPWLHFSSSEPNNTLPLYFLIFLEHISFCYCFLHHWAVIS